MARALTLFLGLAFLVSGFLALPVTAGNQDVGRYRDIVQGWMTSTEDMSEYPPLATLTFVMADRLTGELPFHAAWLVFLTLAVLAALAYAFRDASGQDALWLTVSLLGSVVFLGQEVTFARFDLLLLLALFLCAAAFRRGQYGLSGAYLAAAAGLKAVPILCVPLLLLAVPRGRRLRTFAATAAAGSASLLLPAVVLGGGYTWANALNLLRYHGARGIQAETLWSSLHLLASAAQGGRDALNFHHLALHNDSLGTVFPPLSLALVLTWTLALTVFAARRVRAEPGTFGLFLLLLLAGAVGLGSILSPQYLVWCVPLLMGLACVHAYRAPAYAGWMLLWIAVACLTQWVYPLHYGHVIEQSGISTLIVLALRNILLVAGAAAMAGWMILRKREPVS